MIRNYKSKNTSNKLNNEVSVNVIIPHETKKKMMKRKPAEQRMRDRKSTQDIPISNIQQTPSNILYGNPAVPLNNPNIPAGISFPSAQPLTYQNTSYVFNAPRTSTVSNYSAEIARGLQVPNEEEIQRPTVEVSLNRIEEAQQQQEEQARQNGVLALAEIGRQERRNENRMRERTPSYASIASVDNVREQSPSVEDFNFQDIYNQPFSPFDEINPLLQTPLQQRNRRLLTPITPQILNPKTNRMIKIGGKTYKNLLKEGYIHKDNELLKKGDV
jgi:hypothetical protein